MKVKFKKEDATPAPKVLINDARFNLLQESKLSFDENGDMIYILKFEFVTNFNGLQAITSVLQSDGSINVQVLDGKKQDGNND